MIRETFVEYKDGWRKTEIRFECRTAGGQWETADETGDAGIQAVVEGLRWGFKQADADVPRLMELGQRIARAMHERAYKAMDWRLVVEMTLW